MTKTAEQYRAEAAAHEQERAASFERCDTDGFVSQWASGVSADKARLAAEVAEAGGVWEFEAIFDLEGNHVPAKEIKTQYGWSWMLLDGEGQRTGWFNPSQARNPATARANNAKKGFYLGTVKFAATVVLGGGGTGLSGALSVRPIVVPVSGEDLAMGRGIEVVDNGQA
jgi:hypothetical protein